jgi:NAD(P)-dependent dehydrogenase (short-subunit alcohol dehydrogenase family)
MSALNFHKLQGKHVLVIGGTGGIGRAVAEGSAASGAVVSISGSRQETAERNASEIKALYPHTAVHGFAADLADPATVEDALEHLFQSAAAVQPVNHVVFAAADPLSLGGLDSVTPALIAQAAHFRFAVPVLVGKVAARHLARATASSITITGGAVAEKPDPGWAVMSYIGAGLAGLGRGLAVDLKPIRVNVVQPSYVDTGLWGEARDQIAKLAEGKMLTGRFARVEDVAEAYLWVMRDENATGTVAKTDGGFFLV